MADGKCLGGKGVGGSTNTGLCPFEKALYELTSQMVRIWLCHSKGLLVSCTIHR